MFIESFIAGKYVNLRSVTVNDAAFILQIRNNPEISRFLPPLKVTIEQQQQWIEKQRNDNDSYYFLMEDKDGNPIGTTSVYDIKNGDAETGRLCSLGAPSSNVEACMMLHDFCFNIIGLTTLHIWVYEDNKPVINLNHSLGYE